MRVTLLYQDIVFPTAALNTWARQYRLTSLFDPDSSGVGNQPLSFDEWMRLYLNYRVEQCSYDLEIATRTANSTLSVSAAPYGGGTVITDAEVIATQPLALTSTTTAGGPPARLKKKIHASTVYGVPVSTIATNDQFWGTATTNPTLETMLNIAVTTSGATDVSSYKLVLKFKVVFFRPGLVLLSAIRQKKKQDEPRPSAALAALPAPVTYTAPGPSAPPVMGVYPSQDPIIRPRVQPLAELMNSPLQAHSAVLRELRDA